MLKLALLLAAIAATVGIGWPLASSIAGGGGNEATRLVEAADRTQNKAQSLSRSYNDVIPPQDSLFASLVNPGSGAADNSGTAEDEPTPAPTLTPSEHAVKDAMDFLNQVQQELEPRRHGVSQGGEPTESRLGPRATPKRPMSSAASSVVWSMPARCPPNTWKSRSG